MTNTEAIEILKRLQDPEPWEPQLNSIAYSALDMAISALEKRTEVALYDQEEIHHNCTVQVLRNSVTGDVSVGWREEKEEEE